MIQKRKKINEKKMNKKKLHGIKENRPSNYFTDKKMLFVDDEVMNGRRRWKITTARLRVDHALKTILSEELRELKKPQQRKK